MRETQLAFPFFEPRFRLRIVATAVQHKRIERRFRRVFFTLSDTQSQTYRP